MCLPAAAARRSPSGEKLSPEVRTLVEEGKKRGFVTYDELNKVLPDDMTSPEKLDAVLQVMDDLRSADVDFLTIGQYLQPTVKHLAVARFVPPEEFEEFARHARAKGFSMVSASPLTRSSYLAGDDFARLQAARAAKLAAGQR